MNRLLWILLFLCCFSPSGATADDGDQKRYKDLYELGLLNIGSPEGSEYFKKSAEVNPDFPANWYWLGYESCRAGNDPEAIRYFEKFLQVARNAGETGRIKVATAVLAELRSGKPGDEVERLRSKD